MELPKRTYATELSDSELILLDCMFSYSVPRPVLEAETAFLGIPVSKFQQAELHSNNLIYWKKGENAFECSYITQEMNSMRGIQWELYEKNRTWWRTIGELQKFLPNIPICSTIVDK